MTVATDLSRWSHAHGRRHVDLGDGLQDQRLTATVTATAAANGHQQRPVAADSSRTIRADWGICPA